MKEYEQKEESESIAQEPEAMYELIMDAEELIGIADDEFDIDDYYEKHKEKIEAAYKKLQNDNTKAPEGYFTLKEFDELLKKKLIETALKIHPEAKTLPIMKHRWTVVFHIEGDYVIVDRILPSSRVVG